MVHEQLFIRFQIKEKTVIVCEYANVKMVILMKLQLAIEDVLKFVDSVKQENH